MLPLTFENPADYDKVDPFDKISLKGLTVRITRPSSMPDSCKAAGRILPGLSCVG
jgi:hypothetical protein